MAKLQVTVKQIMEWDPCEGYTEEVVKGLFSGRIYLNAKQILDLDISIADKFWAVLREELIPAEILYEFGCQCAERVLPIWEEKYPDDDRPRKAIEAKRAWMRGEITDKELKEAGGSAYAGQSVFGSRLRSRCLYGGD